MDKKFHKIFVVTGNYFEYKEYITKHPPKNFDRYIFVPYGESDKYMNVNGPIWVIYYGTFEKRFDIKKIEEKVSRSLKSINYAPKRGW